MKHFFSLGYFWQVVASLLVLLAVPGARAQAPAWQAAVAFTGTQSYVTATAAGGTSAIYLTGHFTGTAVFNSITLTSTGVGSDIFVAKWDCVADHFAWAVRAGGSTADIATALTVSGTNVYITGWFSSADASFGASTLANASSSTTDLFVAKLTDRGSTAAFGWARQVGGAGYEYGAAIAARGTAVYVAGSFNSPALTFGTTTLPNVGQSAFPTTNGFVGKLLDTGNTVDFAWAQRCGGESSPAALVCTEAGLYVTGTFAGTGSFGSFTQTAASTADIFVAKLKDQGATSSYAWVQQPRTPSGARASSLAVSGASVYLAGLFYGTAQFGATALTSAGAADVFVAKLTDAGPSAAFVWAVPAGGAGVDEAYAVVAEGTHVYVSGDTGSPAVRFGSLALTHTTNSYFSRDGFLAHLTDAGSQPDFTWVKAIGGEGNDRIEALTVSNSNVFAAGYISPAAAFDTFTVPASAGLQIGFLATLTNATVTASALAPSRPAFAFFPNPARTTTTITLAPTAARTTLVLVDALGRPVRTIITAGGAAVVDLAGLASGLYVLRGGGQAARLLVE